MAILEAVNEVLWGLPMVVLLLGTGVFLTLVTRGMIFRKFGRVLRDTLGSLFHKLKRKTGEISPFEAVCTALAGTVGTGNIAGVALALAVGGPGALFWLWISALVGMVLKFSEVTLAVAFRTVKNGDVVGGPMYYMQNGLHSRFLAVVFAILGALAAFGTGAPVQAHTLTVGVASLCEVAPWVVGAILSLIVAVVLFGGAKRIVRVSTFLVPCMAVFYMVGAGVVLFVYRERIPAAFGAVFGSAFSGTAATGGFAGASFAHACRVGLTRGVFTHEAGMGSAPLAHATATTDHPARQGLWGAVEVFLDSIVMCTVTGLAVLVCDVWQSGEKDGVTLCAAAFETAFPGGRYVVVVGLILFAFATIVAWYYYGEKCAAYLFDGNRWVLRIYRLVYIGLVFFGCIMGAGVVWELADLFNGLMAVPNLVALLLLSPVVKNLSEEFFGEHVERQEQTPALRHERLPRQREPKTMPPSPKGEGKAKVLVNKSLHGGKRG